MNRYITLFFLLCLGYLAKSQDEVDALRYSQEGLSGSARFVAMGGAFGALGANASSANHNPAGIVTYTTNEFSGSIGYSNLETQSHYHSSNTLDQNKTLFLPNINYVNATVFDPEQVGDWNRINFGIGYNRLNDYNQDIELYTLQNEHSLSKSILDGAQGTYYNELNNFREWLAFDTYLIDTLAGGSNYASNANFTDKSQRFQSLSSGSKNEFYISFGAAYQNKLFLGATIGFPTINYENSTKITELNEVEDEQGNTQVEGFSYLTNLKTTGSGINLKLGLIYKINPSIRYGFALHTPTYYEMEEQYWTSMSTNLLNQNSAYKAESNLGVFDYDLYTPFKMTNSFSFVIGKKAIVSMDYEFLDYSMAKFNSDFFNLSSGNKAIKSNYQSTSNLKIGSEFRIHPQISLRAGYAKYGSPFNKNLNDASKEYLTMGFGLQVDQYFFDFALVKSTSQEDLYIYDGANSATIKSEKKQILISAGFKF